MPTEGLKDASNDDEQRYEGTDAAEERGGKRIMLVNKLKTDQS